MFSSTSSEPCAAKLKARCAAAGLDTTVRKTDGEPGKGRFKDKDIDLKRPGYTFANEIDNMGLTSEELSRLIDCDNNGTITESEFSEVTKSLGVFTDQQVSEMGQSRNL